MGRNKKKDTNNPKHQLTKRQIQEQQKAESLRLRKLRLLKYSLVGIVMLAIATFVCLYFLNKKWDEEKSLTYRNVDLEDKYNRPLEVRGISTQSRYKYKPLKNALDIVNKNLECAKGLYGSENINEEECIKFFHSVAYCVKESTKKNMHQFYSNPEDYDNSEAFFRAMMLVTVLERDFNFQYSPYLVTTKLYEEESTRSSHDSKDVFIHGLVYNRTGSCSSFPVFTVAVGRLLGYPLKLVAAKGHLFSRWDGKWQGEKVRFNIDHCGHGMRSPQDSYYQAWPRRLTEKEKSWNCFLKSMTPEEEYSAFLASRAFALMEHKRYAEAEKTFARAYKLTPNQKYLLQLQNWLGKVKKDYIAHLERQNKLYDMQFAQKYAELLKANDIPGQNRLFMEEAEREFQYRKLKKENQ